MNDPCLTLISSQVLLAALIEVVLEPVFQFLGK
jgi:hypothetical protein